MEEDAHLNEVYESLYAYEQLGVTPEQIVKIDELYTEKCREYAVLEKCCDELREKLENALRKLQKYEK